MISPITKRSATSRKRKQIAGGVEPTPPVFGVRPTKILAA